MVAFEGRSSHSPATRILPGWPALTIETLKYQLQELALRKHLRLRQAGCRPCVCIHGWRQYLVRGVSKKQKNSLETWFVPVLSPDGRLPEAQATR